MLKIFFRKAAVKAGVAESLKSVLICPLTGLPYGEPESTERLLWVFAMNDLEDAEEREFSWA